MGDCKSNMKSSKDKKPKERGLMGLLPRKKDKRVDDVPRKFADIVEEADQKIMELVALKKAELASEYGDEEYNGKALAHLKVIQYHIDEVIEGMNDYAELKK